MSIYKRGGVYWYEFRFKGGRIQESSRTANKEAARQIEAAHRVRLSKGEAGIQEMPSTPTLRVLARISQADPDGLRQQAAYGCLLRGKTKRRLADTNSASSPLDRIDEGLIEAYQRAASINRERATLRRLLRMAKYWKRTQAVPKIKLLRSEKPREFVLSLEDEPRYLNGLPEVMTPLCMLLIETGLRMGAALKLE